MWFHGRLIVLPHPGTWQVYNSYADKVFSCLKNVHYNPFHPTSLLLFLLRYLFCCQCGLFLFTCWWSWLAWYEGGLFLFTCWWSWLAWEPLQLLGSCCCYFLQPKKIGLAIVTDSSSTYWNDTQGLYPPSHTYSLLCCSLLLLGGPH